MRDPRQARFLTVASLRWVLRHRAWTPGYLIRYWRFAMLRLRHRNVITTGFVFLGRRVRLEARPGYGRIVLGRWIHVGDDCRIRCHEGTLAIGDKAVLGRDVTVNGYLDVEIGAACLIADSVFITDFDHRIDRMDLPVKDQGLVKTPVRIGPDCWIGMRASVLRGSVVGAGTVVGAGSVVRGRLPAGVVAAGAPARVLRRRAHDSSL